MSNLWSAQAKLSNNDAGSNSEFGYSVDLDLNEVVIGAIGYNFDAGNSYIYNRLDGVWYLKWVITAVDHQNDDWFGYAAVIQGRHVIVSAPSNDDNGFIDSGSIYYVPNVDVPTSAPSLSTRPSSLPSNEPSSYPSTGMPSSSPVTSCPSRMPVTSRPSSSPSAVPTVVPTTSVNNILSVVGNDSKMIFIISIIAAVLGMALGMFSFLHICAFIRSKCGDMNISARNQPVVAEVEVISHIPASPSNSMRINIASVHAIEYRTSTSRKKNKRKASSDNVAQVLPFATHIADYVPVAESV